MELQELIARESIRDLVARYNANGDSGRFEQVLELFAPHATMQTDHGSYRGLEEIRTIFTGASETLSSFSGGPPSYLRHVTGTHQVDLVDATSARGRCYYLVLMEHGVDHWGRYLDEYGLVDGRWRFTSRRVTMDGCVPDGWGAMNASAAP